MAEFQPTKCDCFLPRYEDCEAWGFPDGCWCADKEGTTLAEIGRRYGLEGESDMQMNELKEAVARAIWAKRPDCNGKPWPIQTEVDRRGYNHNPIAAVDLCYLYADAAIKVIKEREKCVTSETSTANIGGTKES